MPDDTTDPKSITFKVLYDQGKETQTCVKANTAKIGVVEGKIDTHLTETRAAEKVKKNFWDKGGNIIKLIVGIIVIFSALWAAGKWLRPDMKALAAEIKKEMPKVDYDQPEEDPE